MSADPIEAGRSEAAGRGGAGRGGTMSQVVVYGGYVFSDGLSKKPWNLGFSTWTFIARPNQILYCTPILKYANTH